MFVLLHSSTSCSRKESGVSDIQAGDLVECVNDRSHFPPDPLFNPSLGAVYRVAEIFPSDDGVDLCEDPSPDPEWTWPIEMFRKIDKADEQFTETVRACRPIKTREDA
jgi:hypothetical protein